MKRQIIIGGIIGAIVLPALFYCFLHFSTFCAVWIVSDEKISSYSYCGLFLVILGLVYAYPSLTMALSINAMIGFVIGAIFARIQNTKIILLILLGCTILIVGYILSALPTYFYYKSIMGEDQSTATQDPKGGNVIWVNVHQH